MIEKKWKNGSLTNTPFMPRCTLIMLAHLLLSSRMYTSLIFPYILVSLTTFLPTIPCIIPNIIFVSSIQHHIIVIMAKAPVVVGTVAFGMGIDKSDIRSVIHFDLPRSVEEYVQGNSSQSFLHQTNNQHHHFMCPYKVILLLPNTINTCIATITPPPLPSPHFSNHYYYIFPHSMIPSHLSLSMHIPS